MAINNEKTVITINNEAAAKYLEAIKYFEANRDRWRAGYLTPTMVMKPESWEEELRRDPSLGMLPHVAQKLIQELSLVRLENSYLRDENNELIKMFGDRVLDSDIALRAVKMEIENCAILVEKLMDPTDDPSKVLAGSAETWKNAIAWAAGEIRKRGKEL